MLLQWPAVLPTPAAPVRHRQAQVLPLPLICRLAPFAEAGLLSLFVYLLRRLAPFAEAGYPSENFATLLIPFLAFQVSRTLAPTRTSF